MTGVSLVDGSGLARDNRVTCRALAYTMDLGVRPEFKALLDGLSVAGVSGTLADELIGTGLEGKLKGKTGFLNGVTGLAGIVDVGRPLRFAFVVNGNFGEADRDPHPQPARPDHRPVPRSAAGRSARAGAGHARPRGLQAPPPTAP